MEDKRTATTGSFLPSHTCKHSLTQPSFTPLSTSLSLQRTACGHLWGPGARTGKFLCPHVAHMGMHPARLPEDSRRAYAWGILGYLVPFLPYSGHLSLVFP